MNNFKDTTGWVKIDKWIIEKPERMEKQDRGLRLYGHQNKFHIILNEIRCSVEARWREGLGNNGSDDAKKSLAHYSSYSIIAKGSIEDKIYKFSLNNKIKVTRFDRIGHIYIHPIDPEIRLSDKRLTDQKMTGTLFYDETNNELSLDVSIDRDAFMSVFETVTRSPMVARGYLYVAANLFFDEVDRFFTNLGDIRHYGLLQDGDVYSASAPVGVESLSVSLYSSPPPETPVDTGDDDNPPSLSGNRFFG